MVSSWLKASIIAATVFTCVNLFDAKARCDDHVSPENLQTVTDKIFQAREFWDESVPRLEDGDAVVGQKILIVTHASLSFDPGSIATSVDARVHEALKKGYPVVYVVQTDSPVVLQDYYLKHRPTFLFVSRDGSNGIRLKTEVVQVAGGDFYQCAARTASNAIALSGNGEKATRIELLTDSLYSGGSSIDNYLKNLTDKAMLDFIGQTYLPSVLEYLPDPARPKPDPDRPKPNLSEYTFNVLRDGQLIGTIGTGNRIVEMNFVIKADKASNDTIEEANDCRVQALNGAYYLYQGTSLVGSFDKPTKALKTRNSLMRNRVCRNQAPSVECRVITHQGYYNVYQGISLAASFKDPLEAVGLRNLLVVNNACKAQTPKVECRIEKTTPLYRNDFIFYDLYLGQNMGFVNRLNDLKSATQIRDFLVDEKVCVMPGLSKRKSQTNR